MNNKIYQKITATDAARAKPRVIAGTRAFGPIVALLFVVTRGILKAPPANPRTYIYR